MFIFFFFKQKTAYEIRLSLVVSEMYIRNREQETHEDTDDGDNQQEFHKDKAANNPSLHVNPSKKEK